ncbi:MAG: hypothetical protein ACTHOL_17940 [Luteibacter jiangsuensis]
MSNVRKLVARLNASTCRFDIGRGGIPELTPQDIAGALGMVPRGLGREVFEACWWPDGALIRHRALRDAVLALVVPEIAKRDAVMRNCRLDVQIAESSMGWSAGRVTAEQIAELRKRNYLLEQAQATAWPKNVIEKLPIMTKALIVEIGKGQHCEACSGASEITLEGGLRKVCEKCGGTGQSRSPDLQRAKAMCMDSRSFVRTWKPVYEWMLAKFRESEAIAAKRFMHALGHSEAA